MFRLAFLLAAASLTAAPIPAQQSPIGVKEALAPQYPPIAVAARVTGEVVVRVEVGPDGSVLSAKDESGPGMLRKSATQAAMKWIFTTDPAANRASTLRFIYLLSPEDDPDEVQTVFLPPDAIRIKHRPMKTTVIY
jgi:TonB family protein